MSQIMKSQRMHATRLATELDRLVIEAKSGGDPQRAQEAVIELADMFMANIPAITDALRFYARGGKNSSTPR